MTCQPAVRPLRAALALIATTASACFATVPPPPTTGYGAPYHGTGEPIVVSDTTSGWGAREGSHAITTEQALEATGDAEYEARRQNAKRYNARVYDEGRSHARTGTAMVAVAVVAVAAGLFLSSSLANGLRSETTTAATAMMPETRDYSTGFVNLGGYGLVGVGVLTGLAGYYFGSRTPPYHEWKTPDALNRPAYVRQMTEPYNEKLDTKTAGVPALHPAPPRKMPAMRGDN